MEPGSRVARYVTAVLVVLVAGGAWFAFSLRPPKAKIGPGGSTDEQFGREFVKYNRATVVEPYRTVGARSPVWDEQAMRYLEACALRTIDQPDKTSNAQLIAEGEKLVRSGCTDPTVLYCYGAALQRKGDLPQAERTLRLAVDGLAKSRYPRSSAFLAPFRLAEICLREGPAKKSEVNRWRKLAISWIGEAAGEKEVLNGGQREFLRGVDSRWNSVLELHWREVYDAVRANPKADPYVVAVIGGRANVDEGWRERGGNWASEVTEEGWRGFGEHLTEARKLYTRAWRMHPEFPEAPAEMITVSMGGYGGSRHAVYTWFNRAVAAQVDYMDAYDKLLSALRPRWGGSYEAMYRVGLASLESGRFDTDVPLAYLLSLQRITEDTEGDRSYWTRPETCGRLRGMFAGYAKVKQTDGLRRRYQALGAMSAWYLGKYDDARAAFDELGDGARPEVLDGWRFGATLEEARDEAYALSGAYAAPGRQARQLLDAGDYARAVSSYRSLLATANGHAAHYYRRRLAEAETEARWERGEWMDLRPQPDFAGWIHEQGDWTVEPDGGLRGASAERGLWLLCDRDFGHRLEFEGEVDLVSFTDEQRANFGVLVDATGTGGGGGFIAFEVSRPSRSARLTADLEKEEGVVVPTSVQARNTFRVQLWDGKVTTFLNGRPLHRGVQMEKTSGPAPERVGVGSAHGGVGAVVRFRNLRVRLLKAEPE